MNGDDDNNAASNKKGNTNAKNAQHIILAQANAEKMRAQPQPIILHNNINIPVTKDTINQILNERRNCTYADIVCEHAPGMEQQEPGNIQTASTPPRVKLEPNVDSEKMPTWNQMSHRNLK